MDLSPPRKPELVLPSNRSIGLLFTAVFAVVAIWPLLSGGAFRIWAAVVSAALAATALLAPDVLAPLNRAWMRFGALLHRLTSPVVLALVYFAVITPFGLAMRAAGRRPLALARDPSAQSYWTDRDPPGPEPDSIRNQF